MESLFARIFLSVVLWISPIHCETHSDYAIPRFLILGPTAPLAKNPLSSDAVGQVKDGRTSACGIDIDCCDSLTNEINALKSSISDLVVTDQDINDRLDHFNERLNANTGNIVVNELAIQTNEKQIDTNTNNIDNNANKIDTNFNNIDANTNKIDTNIHNIDSNANEIDTNTHYIATNKDSIDTLTQTTSNFVSFCGYREEWKNRGTVTYERIAMNINSFQTGGLDSATGVFTPPTQGTYLVSANFYTTDSTGRKSVYVNKNGKDMDYGQFHSYTVGDGAGGAITVHMSAGDTLYLNVKEMHGWFQLITFCITFLK